MPENFRNWFVIRFDKPFAAVELTDAPASYEAGSRELYPEGGKAVEGDHAVATGTTFTTVPWRAGDGPRGLVVHLRGAGPAETSKRSWERMISKR